jgi:phosphoribosylanthranilate isomerase
MIQTGAPAIKICGLTRTADARVAEAAGATYGGIIVAPGSPRRVEWAAADSIFGKTALVRCAVVVDEKFDVLVRQVRALRLGVVQLHGDEPPDFAEKLRSTSGAAVWKAVRPRSGAEFLTALERFADRVDGLIVDGWSDHARGGTGTRFPWKEVAEHRSRMSPSLMLIVAGGLAPGNVADVVALLDPHVVDVSSGVEQSPGLKNPELIHAFAHAVRSARAREGVG